MTERHVLIALPDDVSNAEYARIAHGVQAVLDVVGLGDRSTIRTDGQISDEVLIRFHDEVIGNNPWA